CCHLGCFSISPAPCTCACLCVCACVCVCVCVYRSCRLAPLVQCDYCPLLFHMDCLDPPLTAMPTGRWMCPNHVEHLVVSPASFALRGGQIPAPLWSSV